MGSDGSVLVGFDWSTGDHPLGSSVIFYVCLSPHTGDTAVVTSDNRKSIWRFPARESRCRRWSPEEASMGRCRSRRRSALGREAGDVTDLDQQTGSTGRADAVQPGERGARSASN
jgi:hypothetical protein